MKIAVLSGKGGTGKTFISVNLASVINNSTYADCDVEEPNGFLFLKPHIESTEKVSVYVPEVDSVKCDGCRECAKFCRYNAIAFIKGKPHVFGEMCHSCGGCALLCHNDAIKEHKREIGFIQYGTAGGIRVCAGVLNNGEVTGVQIIRKLVNGLPKDGNTVVDCPPGSACTVMESINGADYCILAAEPTAFGLENMEAVFKLLKLFRKKCGIVINKDTGTGKIIEKFAEDNNIPVLMKIPYDKKIASINADGAVAVKDSEYKKIFSSLYSKISEDAGDAGCRT